jgi:endonuclease-8
MPEGDTIYRTAEALRRRLLGKPVVEARPRDLARLTGSTVTAVEPVGKHLLVRFSSGLVLHSHMRMNGTWHIYMPGQRWLKPERLARAVLATDDTIAVCFNAPLVRLTREPEVSHLGPDVLADDFDLALVVSRARGSPAPTLGELLLDQKVAAGIGNVFKCEALWWLRLDPWLPPERLDDTRLAELYRTAHDFMRPNRQGLGRRFPYGDAAVHGRAGRPCRRCSSLIKAQAQGVQARTTYYCPSCQAADQRPTLKA